MSAGQRNAQGGFRTPAPLVLTLGATVRGYSAETVSEDEKSWYVEGYAATGQIDLTQYAPLEKQPKALQLLPSALKDILQWMKTLPTVFRNHVLDEEVGNIVDARIEDGDKLWIKVRISKTRPDIWEKILDGTLSKFSVSFLPTEEYDITVEGVFKPVRQIVHAIGLETSVVGLPMNPGADITAAYAAGATSHDWIANPETLAQEPGMEISQLVTGIKERLAKMASLSGEDRAEIVGEIRDFHTRLTVAAGVQVADPLATDAWDFAPAAAAEPAVETAPVVEAAAPAPEVTAPVVAETPAAAPIAAAIAEGLTAAEPTPAEPTAQDLLNDGVKRMFEAVVKRSMPASVFMDMACLEQSLEGAELPDKVKAKAGDMLLQMLRMVAENTTREMEGANTKDLGAVQRSFDERLSQMQASMESSMKAQSEQIIALQRDLAAKAEALGKLEKRNADLAALTQPPASIPPVVQPPQIPLPKVPLSQLSNEERAALWAACPPISLGQG